MLEKFKEQQPVAYKIVKNSLDNSHYAHAYLIETNGYDKGLQFAIVFAKLLLCPKYNNGQVICQDCIQCKMIDDNNYPELSMISPDGSLIKKEQLTELQEEFTKKSLIGNKKVYIINKAETLNIYSANTILKFLEEPPEGIIAILVTKNKFQLLDTIVSRCQIISLNGQVDFKQYATTRDKIGQLLTDDETEYLSFIENDSNDERINSVVRFFELYEKKHKKILLYLNEYWFTHFNDKELFNQALMIGVYFYKDVLNYKINNDIEIFNDYEDTICQIADLNEVTEIIRKINTISENRKFLDNNANLNLLIDKIIIELEEGVK